MAKMKSRAETLVGQERKPKVSPSQLAAFSIRRQVYLADGQASQLHHDLRKGIERAAKAGNIPGQFAKNCKIVQPAEMAVTVVERGRFQEDMWEAGVNPKPIMMFTVAQFLRKEWRRRLDDTPPQLSLPLGNIERFGRGGEQRKTIGVVPLGWRGPRRSKFIGDIGAELDGPSLLLEEKRLCSDAITNHVRNDMKNSELPEELDFSLDTMACTPHISLVRNEGGFRDHQFRALQPIIENALPSELLLEDPVFDFNKVGRNQPKELSMRPQPLQAVA